MSSTTSNTNSNINTNKNNPIFQYSFGPKERAFWNIHLFLFQNSRIFYHNHLIT